MSEGAWSRFLDYAAHARTKPTFDLEERQPLLEAAAALRRVLEAARDEGDWQGHLLRAFRPPTRHPLVPARYRHVPPRQRKWLRRWATEDPDSLRAVLAGFLDSSLEPLERFARFAAAGERATGPEDEAVRKTATLSLGSLLGFAGAPESLPPLRPWAMARLRELLGLAPPADPALAAQYGEMIGLTRDVEARMRDRGISIRDLADVQRLILTVVREQALWTEEPPSDWVERSERRGAPGSVYLAACSLYRDEAPYLREWIEFHRLAGVEHFYLYDNHSTDDHLDVLGPYLEEGIVTLEEWAPAPPDQREVFDECLHRHRRGARWIAFLDIDEFLFSPRGESVGELLHAYESWPGVGVNWAMFGTSGHRTRPAGLVTESYAMSDAGETGLIKSIVDPLRATRCESSHHFAYEFGLAVDENGWPIVGAQTMSTAFERLRINHYVSRSEEDAREKLGRAGSWNHLSMWRKLDLEGRLDLIPDDAIARHLPALKAALARPEER